MHLYPTGRKKSALRIILPLVLFAAILVLFLYGMSTMTGTTSEEHRLTTERSIKSALISCYATEGFYPPSIEYLEDYYGLSIDYSKYYVVYELMDGDTRITPGVSVKYLADTFI